MKLLLYRSFDTPKPCSDVIQDSVGTFTVELDRSLRRGSCRDFIINVNFRHDVFRFLFNNKTTLYFNDFDKKYLKEGWNQCFSDYREDDDYNTGHKIVTGPAKIGHICTLNLPNFLNFNLLYL